MAKTKVDAMWEDLKSKGYFQSDKATFDKYFYAPGEKGYKNRKALYDDLHNKGYLQSPTYEDFAQRIGLHATGNAGNASAHGTTQSMLPADVEERRMRTAKPPTPLNKSKARQRLMQQQQAIQRQQKQWQQQADRLRRYDEKRSTTLPGGMERLGERAQERLATGQAAPVPIAPNPEVVRGDMVMGDDGRMQQSYQVGSTPYTSRAGAEAVLYRQAHPLEDELQQAYLERERLQEQMKNVDSGTHRFNIGSMSAGMPSAYGTYAAVFNSPEFAMLSSAYHKNEQRIKTLERERDADGFWSTLGKELFSLDTWDFGAQEFMDASTMMRYFDRDDLTDQERGARQSMLENAFAKNAADQQYGQNDTFMQRAASITAQALPFVAQFLATGGMSGLTEGGAELGAKAAARWATGKVGEWMLKNTGVLLGDLAAGFAMANTVGMLQTGADIMGRRQGQLMMGPDGSFYFADGKSWGRSIWEGEAANTLEYYTEMLGAHLDGLVAGAIGRAALRPEGKLLGGWLEELGDKVGLSALSDVFSRITGSELQAVTTNILRRGGVNEIPSEIFEEESNLLLNALLVGDNKISDLWDPKTQADIWGGMCLSVGFMQSPGVIGGAYQTAQYYRYKHATDVADQKARARLGDEQWDALKTLLDGASNQEIPVVIANMRADSDMSTLGKTAVMDYAKNLLKMRGYNLRTAAEAKSQLQQPDEAQPAVKDESGTSFAEGYNAGEQDMEPIKNRLEAAQRTLTQMGYDVSALNGRQLQDFSQESLAGMPDDERAALLEFFNARAAFEGMRQKVNDDVDTQVQHASDLVDMQTNRDTGMMHRAVLNNGQEVYVTVGRIVMTGDGTMVDTEASDESLFGYNTATGEVGQYTPQDFKSVDDPVNPEQAKAESAENIRREVAGRAAAAINGDLAFNDGDEFDILGGDNATHHIQVLGQQDEGHVVASIDGGEAQVIPKNELQAMHDNLKDAVKDMEDAAADAENTEEPLQSNGPLDNAAPVEERPAEEQAAGHAIMPVPGQGDPQEMLNYFRASGISDRVADRTITNNIVAANERLNKAERELNESKETDPQKLVELENAVDMAQRELYYWNAVARLKNGGGETAAQQRPTEQAGAPVAENEMKPVEAAPAVETPAEQEPTEQTPEAEIPEQRKSLSEETGVLEGDRGALAQSMSPRTLEMIHKIAQQLGLKIRVYNNPDSAGENGYFDPNSNTIWVNTARRTGKLASWVLGHEMTHAMDARATDKKSKAYKDFKRIAVSFVRSVEGIEAYEARIRRTMERYKNAPGVDASKVTRGYIEDEVACDMAGELLAEGPEFMERLFRDATDRNALERVLDAVRDFVDRMLSILNANSDEYRALTILRDSMNKMYNDVKIQGEISNELEPEADAEVETDITPADEDRQERKDRQRAKRVKRKRAKRKSVTAIVEGAGMQASENVMETWKVPQADGTFKEEDRWVKRPLLDEQDNVVFRMGDKEFNGNNPVSVEDLEENPDTVLNYMLDDAVNIGKLSEKKAGQIRQKYADMLNAYLRRGMTDENGTGLENLENSWMWAGEAAYKTVASNSDEQYSYSLDITRVCKKNEAVIRAISALQMKTGYGVTPGQIMDIYLTTDAEGYQVPCPVCYVFSRYINNGKYATAIVNGMQKYGKYLPGQAEEKDLAWWVDKYNEENAKAKKMKSAIDNANSDVKTILQNIDTLSREITGGTLSDEEREAKLRELHDMDERYRAALDVISQEAMPRWIKAFVLAGSAKDGWRMREDAAMPEDMDDFVSHALDIRKTASAMVKYPAITRYRRAGGSAGGKEITFASNNDMGSIAMALGISKSNLDNFNNYYQLALEAGTEEERKALLEKARKRFGDARLYTQRQTLRGGQRMWSWSDNIEALASDVASNLMQLEMLGGALQTYSKQLEGVKMVAAMNGYVNASLMGYGDGVMEVDEDNITTDKEGRRVLAQDITEVNNKGRERIIANAGSPIYRNEDGKDYVLVFDDVVGIDPFGHEGNDGKFRRGLFALNEEYDRAGNILVGMNDIHVRAAMADPRVFFIIPWHASGMSNHILMQMFRVLGVDTENFKATDYTKMQEETNFLERTEKGKLKHKVTQSVRDFWNSHTYEGEFRSGIGHVPNGDRKEGLSKQQLHYRELRDAIFDGTIDNEDKKDWKRQVERDEFLSQVYRQVTTRVDDGKMTEKDKEFIYPYEYWDESSTYETADINGKRYLEYCRRMGFKPKFTGRYDEKAGYSPEGNFADDPGYWKLLIDRRMYDREGKFQDLTPVDSEGLEPNMYDPKETQKEFNVTEVATNEGAERIADIVYQQEVERSGSMPTPNLNTTLEGAVEQYKDTVKRQADRVKAEKKAKEAEEAERIKAEKAAERARKKAKQRKSLGDFIEEAVQSAAIPQPEEANDSDIRYSLRTKPAPKKTLPVYKLMRLGDDGKLYPLYIDGAVPIELGTWYDADSPNMDMLANLPAGVHLINPETGEATSLEDYNKQRGITKKSKYPSAEAVNEATANGMRWVYIEPTKGGQRRFGGEARRYWNLGINGSGTVSTYSMRPGWHAGSLPTMRQIGKGPGRNLRDDRFVWVEGEISADVDYNEEAQGNPDNDIPTHIPVDGFYLKATNANAKASQADRVGWYISGAFKANRIMSDSEARDVIDAWNADPKHKDLQVEYDFPRESGKVFNAETMQLEDDDNGPDGPKGGKRFSLDSAVAEAEQLTETNPTDGQKESGNYRKGHVKVDGFDISIEQPKGSVRSGVDADGKEWSQEMHNTYGYIRGTEGVDGDHIDVFLSDHLDGWNGNVYVVDQVNKDRSFDEHKVMYGFNSEQEAREAYLSNYEEGWTGLGNITGVSREEFKKWVDSSHRKNKPFAEYKNVKPLQSTGTEDRARFSISERTDEAGNEVYAETREDGTKDREVVTMPDGSRDVTWFDEAGRKKEVLSYYPNGEVRQVSNYDSDGELTRQIQYDENRRAIRHWEPRIGTDWERDENGVARGRSNGVEMVRYSLAPTFYSNASKAVEDVKQEKAKAEQWKAMLTKAGGIKAGEDKWMGLSTWLDEHKGETLTKDEVRKFVADNGIEMEETHYSEYPYQRKFEELSSEFDMLFEKRLEQNGKNGQYRDFMAADEAFYDMVEKYGADFDSSFDYKVMSGRQRLSYKETYDGHMSTSAKRFLGAYDTSNEDNAAIETNRLDYTTKGLNNKREIAFVVPGVEPYQEHDEIHFGPENQGRAVMWVRFGETTDTDGNRVLVIDEVQSNRHQDAREKGYRSNEDYKNVQSFRAKLSKEHPEGWSVDNESARKSGLYILSKEEHEELMRLNSKAYGGENRDGIPAAPFERNWHEVAMKRMLRLAAEEGFDKVAWTTGMQQAERYNLGQVVDSIEARNYNERNRKDYNGLQRQITIYTANGETALYVTADGYIYDVEGQGLGVQLEGNTLDNVVGKDLASRLMIDEDVTLSGDGLNVGGEGMRAFYDGILPQFMNKYGKRWGVKTGEVTLDTPGKEVMHSVDVNEDMKRSVMQGQPLFSLSAEQQERQTHSDNFKNWFGDWENDPEHASKVVDAEGRPLVVYRGGKKINTFEPDKASRMAMYGPAFYATPSYVDAQEFGKGRTGNADDVQAVYLDIRNPWVDGPCESLGYPKEATMEQARELVDLLTSKGLVDGGIILAKLNDGRVRSLLGALADAEYEGVERGRGEWWHASAIVQDALKELGYDGVVGRFDIGDGHMVEQVAAFEPTQIKSATENNGEFDPGNPDIRFSISDESQKIFDTAKRKFGETKDIREAGYVLPDGTMLDFSGRHELDPGTDSSFLAGRRTTDHRAINQISFIYDENGDEVDTGVSSDMPDFIRRGAIRIDNNAGSINLSAAPTMAQRRVLRELIRRNGGDVQVDFGDGWNSDHYVEYEEASAQRVLGDIDRYFDEGIKPESNVRFSLSGDGTVEAYNKAVNMTGRTFNVGGREVKPGITRYNFQEAFQDAILSVKKLQQVVERHFGIKLPTRENAWMYENRLSSINMHERKSFIDKVYEPMMKIADRIMKRGVKEKELNAYLICKHGLERNQVFAQRDANEEANEIVRNGGTPDMQQLIDKYRQRDYSGLTGVTGIQGDITDIEVEAQRIVDEFEQRHGQLCDELWDAIRKATQWSLRKSYQSGMMSAATFDHVRNMFQYYVPLRGWSETTAEDVYSYMMGEHGAFNGVLKKAEGRTSVADDPLATIGNMAESALIQGNRNLLKQHLLRMAQNHPTDVCQVRDVWLVEGPGGVWEPHWPNIPEDATPDEIDQILQDHEADMQQLEASGQAKRVRNNLDIPYRIDPKHVPEHAVVAKVAGVDHVIYINGNPRAAQAINGQTGAGRGTKSGFSRLIDFIFGDVKRFYSSVLTSLNINFSGANFVRDLPHAYAMTFMKQGPLKAAEYIAKSFQVIPWVFKNQLGKTGTSQMDRYFQEFLSSGAVTGYAHINDVDAWKANNKRRFARLSALGKAKVAVPRALGEVINAIGWFSETLELIPRFTAFLVERQAGKDIATATKAAKDITTNFNKKGSEVTPGVWGAVANTLRYMKMFFNPIVQGMYQFVDVASMGKENKWVGPRMVLATMHLPVLGAIVPYLNQFLLEALGGDDDDDYWLLNEYTRRNNVCIFTGNGYLKIPIAPVFRELYGMGEVVATRHAGKADNEKTTIDLIDQLRTMGSVEGQSSYNEWSLARFLLPEHFAPLIDVMNNENFTGGPIYYDNNYKEYAPEYTKAKKSTWSPLVAASKWLNEMMGGDEDIAAGNSGKWMNPAVWQHLITNVGGGFAQLAGDVVAGVTDITEGKEIDPSNIPVMKRFYSGSSDERANWARFGIYKGYEKDYTMAKEKYQALDKRGLSLTERADEVVKFAESHPKAAAIYAVWEGGIKGADIPARLEKLGKDDPAYWDLVKEAVGKAEKAMNSGYVRAWEQKRKDRPDSMSNKELNDRFDKSDNDSIRHIMADEISKRSGSQDYYGRDAQAAWSDKSVAAWEAYQDQRTSDDIKADAELSNLLKVDEGEKDKERIKMLGYIKDELNKIRRGKDATSRSAGVKGLGEGDDQRVMNELRAARKQLIEDLKNGSSEQAYRNLERRTMRLGLRKKAKEL